MTTTAPDSDFVLSFSYGSNMAVKYLRQYCPGAEPVMRATLPNVRIEFRRYSTDLGGGISTIMPTPGERVEGVIYRIPRLEIEALDLLEDVDKGLYVRETHLSVNKTLSRLCIPEGWFSDRCLGAQHASD
jgi:gamma-glutamylcyclotransferase (GGCT)/AIG2-like uncharacterized protein YtfP